MALNSDDSILNFDELQCRFNELSDWSFIEENIRSQLAEFEMISSMFSNPGELVLDDPSILNGIRDYASGMNLGIPPYLDFQINLIIEELKFEVSVTLCHNYPNEEPEIFVRNGSFDRLEQRDLNDKLALFISSVPKGEICVLSAISWLQENALLSKRPSKCPEDGDCEPKSTCEDWGRLWIYSHHIYSKTKMQMLLNLASELNLSGFFLPGSPGIICYEGLAEDCDECWKKVKAMSWKKIQCIKRESGTTQKNDNYYRRFSMFEQLNFESKKIPGRQYNMDFREFYKYLVEHNSVEMFKVYFNVEGREPSA